ncbi:hypothetical protein Tco_1088728 [Tanacetum coccineum]
MTAHHNDWDTSVHRSESSSSTTSSSFEIEALTKQMAEMRNDMLQMNTQNQNRFNQGQGFNQNINQNFNQANNYNHNQNYNQNQGQNYNQNIPQLTDPSTDEMLRNFMISSEAMFNSLATSMIEIKKSLQERPQGALPRNTIPNPQEELKAITTQSGIALARPSVPPLLLLLLRRWSEMIIDQVLPESTTRIPPLVVQPSPSSRSSKTPPSPSSSPSELPKQNPHQPSIPYPLRLNKEKLQDKSDIQVHKFLQMLKKLHFNISLAGALALMPKYVKMLKDLFSGKEKLLGLANTSLTENCLAVLLKKLPEKLRDPGKFLIPYDFPELKKCMVLADLGANINLMPLSIWKKLMRPKLIPTRMTLELANRSIAYPAGIAEDVCVQGDPS